MRVAQRRDPGTRPREPAFPRIWVWQPEVPVATAHLLLEPREDYYDPDSARAGEADLLIRKHRNGPTGTDVRLIFDKPHARFRNRAPNHLI